MIDISMLAPANGAQAPQTAQGASAPGTAGFLRLFEIVLGGMPRKSGSAATDPADAGTASDASSSALAVLAGQAGVDPSGASALAAGQVGDAEASLDSKAVLQIASLLQGLGFDVQPAQIAQLGPLDRLQLDQAMEFLQRGLQTGMPNADLLENASFLMPREWDYHGGAETSAPRADSMANGISEPESIDPGQILAATEAVRQILSSLRALPSASGAPGAPSLRVDSGALQTVGSSAADTAPASVPNPSSLPQATAAAPGSVPDAANLAASAPVAREASASASPRRDDAASDAAAPLFGDTDTAPAEVATAGLRPGFARLLDGKRSNPIAASAIRPVGTAAADVANPGHGPKAATGKAAATPAGSNAAVQLASNGGGEPASATMVANLSAEKPQDVRTAAGSQGVKPGSMASEFIGRQVLEKVDVHLKQGKRELTVRLWPEELGEVRLSLRVGEADKLDAKIMVQTESVRQALLDATPQLREALSRHGMEMGRLSVTVDSRGPEADTAGGERRENGARDGQRRNPGQGWREEQVDVAAPLALGVDSGIRDGRNTLDMWS